MTGKTGSLCVRRAVYWDEEKGAEDPEKKGACLLWCVHFRERVCTALPCYLEKPLNVSLRKGVCSNYLCDLKPGDEVQMTGPVGNKNEVLALGHRFASAWLESYFLCPLAGKMMLMPEAEPWRDLIMVATGTGTTPSTLANPGNFNNKQLLLLLL